MGLSKLEKFKELSLMRNVFENNDYKIPELYNLGKIVSIKGKWSKLFFNNTNPIILELACGRGEYTVELARKNPNNNYIGIDIKGNRMYIGAKMALDENLKNVAFLRINIELLNYFFEQDEFSEVWITFPDPFPKFSDRMKRLTSSKFLKYYKSISKFKENTYHLKTDNLKLFRYTIGVLDGLDIKIDKCIENIYDKNRNLEDYLRIKTYYETLHQNKGSAIHYIKWKM